MDEGIEHPVALITRGFEAEKPGITVRRTDAMIAAVTINNGASLYTMDVKHFKPLKAHGLKLLD
jgi:predicted nucleic acid-binding protein